MKYINIISSLVIISFSLLFLSCEESGIDENGSGTLNGVVVGAGDNLPLENVKITTNPASNTVFTNATGAFTISTIESGDYSVQADIDGFVTAFEAANIIVGETTDVVIELERNTTQNNPPTPAILLEPEDDEIIQSTEVQFLWSANDPDEDDELTFTLELRNDINTDVERFEEIVDTTFTVSSLQFGLKYFWQIISIDEEGESVPSVVKSFELEDAPTTNRYLFTRKIEGNNVIISSDGAENEFQITSSNMNSFRPRKNSALNKIAYFQADGAQLDIYTMNPDGTNKFKVTNTVKPNGFNLNEISFSWPQASDKIYFPAFDKLYSIGTNGQGLEEVYFTADGSFISEVEVSDDEDMIVLKTNNQIGYNVKIFAIDFSGAILETIFTGNTGAVSGINLSATNTPKVLYSYDVTGEEGSNYRRFNSRMFIYDFDTDASTDVSLEKMPGTNDLYPRFSPNEASIIFTNTSNDGISQMNIWTLLINDESTRSIFIEDGFMPDWE